MRKILFAIFLILIVVLVLRSLPGWLFGSAGPSVYLYQIVRDIPAKKVAPAITPTPTPSLLPAMFVIPKLKIITRIESVGRTETGAMDVPKDGWQVGWYRGSKYPGTPGTAVISGHYDMTDGKPAVFYNLRKLTVGDEVKIISADGITNTFVVTKTESIPYQDVVKEEVFQSKSGVNLNLITCDGAWNPKEKLYNLRLIVYTTIKSAQ